MEFGKACREEFILEEGISNLNPGAFGNTPKCVLEEKDRLYKLLERRPLEYFSSKRIQLFNNNFEALAKFLHVQPKNIVFTDNTSFSLASIFNSIK